LVEHACIRLLVLCSWSWGIPLPSAVSNRQHMGWLWGFQDKAPVCGVLNKWIRGDPWPVLALWPSVICCALCGLLLRLLIDVQNSLPAD
jgi:hypothetical protein